MVYVTDRAPYQPAPAVLIVAKAVPDVTARLVPLVSPATNGCERRDYLLNWLVRATHSQNTRPPTRECHHHHYDMLMDYQRSNHPDRCIHEAMYRNRRGAT